MLILPIVAFAPTNTCLIQELFSNETGLMSRSKRFATKIKILRYKIHQEKSR